MEPLGTKLLREREAQGLSLEEIASRTRINLHYLKAIEDNDSSQLPGGFFYRSFIRQYARTLGLPDDFGQAELEMLVREEVQREPQETTLPGDLEYRVDPVPLEGVPKAAETRKWVLGVILLTVVLVLCSLAYAIWESRVAKVTDPAKSTADVTQTSPPVQTPVTPASPAGDPGSGAVDPQSQPAGSQAAAPGSGSAAENPAAIAASPATTATTPMPEPPNQPEATKPVASGSVRVVVRARENLWIQASSGGTRLFSGVIRTGDSREFAAEAPVEIKFGNAGIADVEHNGKVIPPVGPRGIVRTMVFGADTYVPAEPERRR